MVAQNPEALEVARERADGVLVQPLGRSERLGSWRGFSTQLAESFLELERTIR